MRIESVNVSMPQTVAMEGKGPVSTGIFKTPVDGPVMVRGLNLDGDGQGDPVNHGGRDKAVYAYPLEDYAYWRETLGMALPSLARLQGERLGGWFGENLTLSDAGTDMVCLGDVLRAGKALLQVSEPRSPCYKLEHKMGLPGFAKQFAESGRVGFYLRVLEEGALQAGDAVTLVERDPQGVSVKALSDMRHLRKGSAEEAERAAAMAGLSPHWRKVAAQFLERAAEHKGWAVMDDGGSGEPVARPYEKGRPA